MPEKLNDVGTVALAAAIISSADKEHDTEFFKSEWYTTLYELLLNAPHHLKKKCNLLPKIQTKNKGE